MQGLGRFKIERVSFTRLLALTTLLAHSSASADVRSGTPATSGSKTFVSATVAGPLIHSAPQAASIPTTNLNPKSKPRDFNAPIAGGDRKGFYTADSASTIFRDKVEIAKKPEIEYFNARIVTKNETELELEAGERRKEPSKKAPQNAEEIFEAFGQPTEDDKILALETAPDSFKGMMAALQINDEQLAWQYAQRYARRMREMKNRSLKSVHMIDSAQKMLEQGSPEAGLMDDDAMRVAALDPKARAFLEKAQEAEEMGANPVQAEAAPVVAPAGAVMSEQAQRAQIRQVLSGRVPVDPKGEVLVYFFFQPQDRASLEMVPDIEALYRSISTQPGVAFKALSFERMSPRDIAAFRASSNTTFPIDNGAGLVKEFKISKSPTVAAISPSTGKAVFEDTKRSFVYFDELVKVMAGR